MRLAAQRVIAPAGTQGVNAFCYLHGPYRWLDRAPPEIAMNPGVLVNSHVEVPPPGNRVRSFLEILAPDATASQQLQSDISDSVSLFENQPFPLSVQIGSTSFQFNVERALAPAWHHEIEVLLHYALAVRV